MSKFNAIPPSKEAELDYYKILNVERTASREEIRKAYKKLAIMYHPDRNPEQSQRMASINNAHEVLSNDNNRRIYDLYGRKGLDLYQRYGNEQSPATRVLFDPILMGVTFSLATAILVLALLFIIFIAQNVDGVIFWNYMAVAIPLWIINFFLLSFVVGMTYFWFKSRNSTMPEQDAPTQNNNNEAAQPEDASEGIRPIVSLTALVSWWIAVLFTITFQILILLRAQGLITISWAYVFIFWWVVEFEIFTSKAISLHKDMRAYVEYRKSQLNNAQHSYENENFTIKCLNQRYSVYFLYRLEKHYFWLTIRVWFSIFVVLQIDNAVAWNWAVVFLPLFIGWGLYLLVGLCIFDRVRVHMTSEPTEKQRIDVIRSATIYVFISCFACILSTIGMFIARENGTHLYQMVTVFIPIYVLISIFICCCCCCLPSCAIAIAFNPEIVMAPEDYASAGVHPASAENDNVDEENLKDDRKKRFELGWRRRGKNVARNNADEAFPTTAEALHEMIRQMASIPLLQDSKSAKKKSPISNV